MEMLKKYFPYSFGAETLGNLIVKAIVYVLVGFIAGAVIGLLAAIPVVNLLVGLVCGIIDIYVVAGVVIAILDFLKILK